MNIDHDTQKTLKIWLQALVPFCARLALVSVFLCGCLSRESFSDWLQLVRNVVTVQTTKKVLSKLRTVVGNQPTFLGLTAVL